MPVEAVPVEFGAGSTREVASRINDVLRTGEYVGHVVVTKTHKSSWNHALSEAADGVVILVNVPETEEGPTA